MNKIKIDIDDIIYALSNNNFEVHDFLNLKTGEVATFIEDFYGEYEEEYEGEFDEFSENGIIEIHGLPSHKQYTIMQDFVETLKSNKVKSHLYKVLFQKKPYRNFKDTLENYYPDLLKEWYNYERSILKQKAIAWLEDNNINAEIIDNYRENS
jgi:hypothetical protein